MLTKDRKTKHSFKAYKLVGWVHVKKQCFRYNDFRFVGVTQLYVRSHGENKSRQEFRHDVDWGTTPRVSKSG